MYQITRVQNNILNKVLLEKIYKILSHIQPELEKLQTFPLYQQIFVLTKGC